MIGSSSANITNILEADRLIFFSFREIISLEEEKNYYFHSSHIDSQYKKLNSSFRY